MNDLRCCWVFLGLLTLAIGCSSTGARVESPEVLSLRQEVREFEYRRDFDVHFFTLLLESEDTDSGTRRMAVRALGRIADPAAVPMIMAVAEAHGDDVELAIEAAFALGQIADARAWSTLRNFVESEPDTESPDTELQDPRLPVLRERAVEALGKLKDAGDDVPRLLARLLEDEDANVRGQAALALWRLDNKQHLDALAAALEREDDPEAKWRIVYALARIDDPATLAPLRRVLSDRQPWVRTFAARGMRTPVDPESISALGLVLADKSAFWTTRVEVMQSFQALLASELTTEQRTRARDILLENLFREKHPLVLRALLLALTDDRAGQIEQDVLLATAKGAGSATVRRAAVEAYGKVAKSGSLEFLGECGQSADPWVRVAAATALESAGDQARGALMGFLDDDDSRPREAAVRVLAKCADEQAWERIKGLAVADPSLAVRGTAISQLKELKPAGWQAALIRAYQSAAAPDLWESRTDILKALAEEPEGRDLSRIALDDAFVSVRRVARRILEERGEHVSQQREVAGPLSHEGRFPDLYAQVGKGSRPRVILETDRGDIVIELYLDDAPIHVSNIIHLTQRGFYDGLLFHRVVPSFVVQGGDPRGDGWGDAGYHLPDEINQHRYIRGAVGMPKTMERDTGGCQIFITHLPTPHLDGRYTVFGQVILGMEVVDQIEVGDRILRARVLDRPR